jgi:hypothetical protein
MLIKNIVAYCEEDKENWHTVLVAWFWMLEQVVHIVTFVLYRVKIFLGVQPEGCHRHKNPILSRLR